MVPWKRRLPVAIAIALVLGAAGTAANTQRVPAGVEFTVDDVHLGDRIAYSYAWNETGADNQAGAGTLHAEWTLGTPFVAGNGTVIPVDQLAWAMEGADGSSPLGWEYLYRAGTDRVAGTRVVVSGGSAGTDDDLLGLPVPMTSADGGTIRIAFPRDGSGAVPDCMFSSVFAGLDLRSGADVRLPPCLLPRSAAGGPQQAESTVWRDAPALRLRGGSLDWTWAPGIPYPVEGRTTDGRGNTTFEFTLVALERGDVPRTLRPLGSIGPAPALAWEAPGRFLLDERGIRHPFPMERALAVGIARSAELRERFAADPQAVAHSARPSTSSLEGLQSRGWEFEFEGAGPRFFVAIERTLPAEAWDLPPSLQDVVADDRVRVSESGSNVTVAEPGRVPTAVSLLQQGSWYLQRPVECYGYTMASVGLGGEGWWAGDCGTNTTVGPSTDPLGVEVAASTQGSQVTLDLNGTLATVLSWDWDARAVAGSSDPIEPPGPDERSVREVEPAVVAPDIPLAVGIGAVASLGGLLYLLWPAVKAGAVGLFSRLRPDAIARSPVRRRILEAVGAQPGIHLNAIGRAVGLQGGALVHHVRALERAGHLQVRNANGYACHFLRDAPASQRRAAGAANSDGARQVLEAVRARPGLSGQELAAATGLQPSTVSYHLQRLAQAGLVEGVRDGKRVRLRPLPGAA